VSPRHTARGIVIHDGKLLLMERWRPGMHYFSIPGGGIEPDETPEECVEREILEETSVQVSVGRQVLELRDGDVVHKIYLCEYIGGEPHLPADSPEALVNNPDNRFAPRWATIAEVEELPFTYWEPLHKPLNEALKNGFKEVLTIVSKR
jgi:8-oxo-dGTP pyrophosphatase MutT (NUDIX family)